MLNPLFWLVFGGTFLVLKIVADGLKEGPQIVVKRLG